MSDRDDGPVDDTRDGDDPVLFPDAVTGPGEATEDAPPRRPDRTSLWAMIAGLAAWVVYAKFGLALLRKAWLNLDLAWAVALVISGVVVLVL